MVKGKYINEEARKAYKKAEKKSEGHRNHIPIVDSLGIKTDMLKMMEEIDKIKMSVRVLATRLNRVDGMGK